MAERQAHTTMNLRLLFRSEAAKGTLHSAQLPHDQQSDLTHTALLKKK